MAQYTNNDLAEMIQSLGNDLSDYKKTTSKELQKFREFMVVQIDRQRRSGNGERDLVKVFKQALVTIGVALGVIATVLQVVLKLASK